MNQEKIQNILKKNAVISIKGIQIAQEDDSNDVELITEGVFYKKDNMYYAQYQESDVTGLEGTTTLIEIDSEHVSLIRSGTVNNHMVFIKGEKTRSYYETPYGILDIGVTSDDLNINVDDKGGSIEVDYVVDINAEAVGRNRFTVSIKEA